MEIATAPFREGHRRLRRILAFFPAREDPEFEPAEVLRLLRLLDDRLKAHIEMQQEQLCPKLLAHPDASVRVKAVNFRIRTAAVCGFAAAFMQRWPDAGTVGADRATFLSEAHDVLDAIQAHMRDERHCLYDFVDQLLGKLAYRNPDEDELC